MQRVRKKLGWLCVLICLTGMLQIQSWAGAVQTTDQITVQEKAQETEETERETDKEIEEQEVEEEATGIADHTYDAGYHRTGYHLENPKREICEHAKSEAIVSISMGAASGPNSLTDAEALVRSQFRVEWIRGRSQHPFEVELLPTATEALRGDTCGHAVSNRVLWACVNHSPSSLWKMAYPTTKFHDGRDITNYAYIRYYFVWCTKSKNWEMIYTEHTYLYDALFDRDVGHEGHAYTHMVTRYEIRPNRYTLRYYAQNGSGAYQDQSAIYDQEVTILRCPYTREHYTFQGWKNGSAVWEVGDKKRNLTAVNGGLVPIYAKWKEDPKSILCVDPKDGRCSVEKESIQSRKKYERYVGEKVEIKDPKERIRRAIFLANGGTIGGKEQKNVEKKQYFEGWREKIRYGTFRRRQESNIYTYGNKDGVEDLIEASYVGDVHCRVPDAQRVGHQILGWDESRNDQQISYVSGEEIELLRDMKLYAKWKKNRLLIEYHMNHGEVSNGYQGSGWIEQKGKRYQQKMEYSTERKDALERGSKFGLKRANYHLDGWAEDQKGGGIHYLDGQSGLNASMLCQKIDHKDAKIQLYAIWEPNVYVIRLDAQKADLSPISRFYEKYDVAYWKKSDGEEIRRIEIPQRKEYDFMGYFTKADGKGKMIIDREGEIQTDPTYFEQDTTLYAFWQPQHQVTYMQNIQKGEEELERVQIKHYKIPLELDLSQPRIAESGSVEYRFLGWSTTRDGSSGLYKEKTYEEEANLILYAMWNTEYYVLYDINKAQKGRNWIDAGVDWNEPYTLLDNEDYTKAKKWVTYEESGHTVPCKFMGWSIQERTLGNAKKQILKVRTRIGKAAVLEAGDIEVLANGKKVDVEEELKKGNGRWVQPQKAFYREAIGTEYEKNLRPYIIKLYAVWDWYPDVRAVDRYFTLEQARAGVITEQELYRTAEGVDHEDGNLRAGHEFRCIDYSEKEFTRLTHEGMISITYEATDEAGSSTKQRISVYIKDASGDQIGEVAQRNRQRVRFIDEDHMQASKGGIAEDSVWNEKEYRELLEYVLCARKVEMKNIKEPWSKEEKAIPGSGKWQISMQEEFELPKAKVQRLQQYLQEQSLEQIKQEQGLERFYQMLLE